MYGLVHYIEEFKECRDSLRQTILKTDEEYIRKLLYGEVDQCTVNVDCKIPEWKEKLFKKKCILEKELAVLTTSWTKMAEGKITFLVSSLYSSLKQNNILVRMDIHLIEL